MINPFNPSAPFTNRHQFLARFRSERGKTDPVQLAVEYSMVMPGEIKAVVLGGPRAQSTVYEALHGSPSDYLSFVSEPLSPALGAAWSDRVVPNVLTVPDPRTEGLIRRAADLRVFDFTIKEEYAEGSDLARAMVFYLYGPKNIWGLRHDVDALAQGRSEYENSDLGVQHDSLRIAVDTETHQEASPADPDTVLSRTLVGLIVRTDLPADELDDDSFIDAARDLADDVLLLTSLASKTWVDWFRYTLFSGSRRLKHVRSTAREPESGYHHDNRMIVASHRLRDFLWTALPRYRAEKDDLRLPILTHIGANDLRYMEAQFLSQFTVLEALRARYARRTRKEQILKNKPASRVRRAVREAIATLDLDTDAIDAIEEKLPELNRPAFASVLHGLLQSLDLRLADLYPSGTDPSIVGIRHKLVHGDMTISENREFSREASRLNILVDRMLLRSLGWSDLSAAPARIDLDWVTRPGIE